MKNWHIIGDEGYSTSPWLLIQYPENIDLKLPQGRYNLRLREGRNCIEV
jgi:hypothetical protein